MYRSGVYPEVYRSGVYPEVYNGSRKIYLRCTTVVGRYTQGGRCVPWGVPRVVGVYHGGYLGVYHGGY